ncbi:MAG: hypothetical protein HY298_16295 [Verrucomicrobia bacterium]|nr:hypothetical protein [Verrucomicrobiota bacterium]
MTELLQRKRMGSAAAPAAVRRALAPNRSRGKQTNNSDPALVEASDEGVVGTARGGRAPQKQFPRSGFVEVSQVEGLQR